MFPYYGMTLGRASALVLQIANCRSQRFNSQIQFARFSRNSTLNQFGSSQTWLFQTWLFATLCGNALFCALFPDLRLRSLALPCVFLCQTMFRATMGISDECLLQIAQIHLQLPSSAHKGFALSLCLVNITRFSVRNRFRCEFRSHRLQFRSQ